MEKCVFSEYFIFCIIGEMFCDFGKDVMIIEVDFKLFILKLCYGKLMKELYEWFLLEKGKSIIFLGWKFFGIMGIVRKVWSGEMFFLDLYF